MTLSHLFRRVTSTVLLFLASLSLAQATHTMGADITYSCTGAGTYVVSLTFFRDCAGILPVNPQTLDYSSASCGTTGSISMTQASGSPIDVTPLCPSEVSACGSGSTSSFGIEQYVYNGNLVLPPGACDDWILSWTNCCRNYAITTLNVPGTQSTYVPALLDNTISPCNNSPIFNNIPTPLVCLNQPVTYNHGVTDPDGDELRFSLVDCFQDQGVPVSYSTPYSSTNLLATSTGVSIDSVTGEIRFTPNQVQIGVICVKVEEYRGGIKIGEIIRDMQFSVLNCNNSPPVASGVNGDTTNYALNACIGAELCFDIDMYDPDSDNVTATWNQGIPSGLLTFANLGSQNPSARFCWTPTISDTGTHFFTVTVEDDNCPLIGVANYAFTVNVVANAYTINASPDGNICEGDSIQLSASAMGAGPITYSWSPTLGLSNPNDQTPMASPPIPTVYTVSALFGDGCEAEENVQVNVSANPNVSISPPIAYICPGNSVTLTANTLNTVSYLWNGGSTNADLSVSPSVTTDYEVIVTDTAGCVDTAQATVFVNTPTSATCDIIYVSSTVAVGNGSGTRTDPANFLDALGSASCSNTIIKMATGTYTIDNAITSLAGNFTLEGGFQESNSWRKTSQAQATSIVRSNLNPTGPDYGKRLIAFDLAGASNFRFQDLTILVSAPQDTGIFAGTSTYAVHMSNCSDYAFVRCHLEAAAGAAGLDGSQGTDGVDGNIGITGNLGNDTNQTDSGEGGAGGAGGSSDGGVGGLGGTNPINGAGCCQSGSSSCCLNGIDGTDGTNSATDRAGGGGGGGASGGEARNDGGRGGRGGGIGPAGAFQAYCATNNSTGGQGGGASSGSIPGGNGRDGCDGQDGSVGATGTAGLAGSHVGGYYVPGGQAGTGGNGEGGRGGTGGGGGGGFGCTFFCNDGAGSGGGGGGGGGEGGTGGTGGRGGGGSFAMYVINNGTGGQILDCMLTSGAAGAGGAGGAGGIGGTGGSGAAGGVIFGGDVGDGGKGGDGGDGGAGGVGGTGSTGANANLYQSGGTAPTVGNIAFDFISPPIIQMDNTSCTNTDIVFYAPTVDVWSFSVNASILTPNPAANVTTQFNTITREDVTFGADQYRGFANLVADNNIIPEASTNANLVQGVYRICEGSAIDFAALNGSGGTVYIWDMDGGATPNTYSGTSFQTVNGVVFNTPGTYDILLRYDEDCCGLTSADTIQLIVDPQPNLGLSGATTLCLGAGAVTLTATGGSNYLWTPGTGLSSDTVAQPLANPASTTTYVVTALNAAQTCFDTDSITIQVEDILLTPSSTDAGCINDGTAAVLATGGTGGYNYTWNTTPAQTTSNISSLAPGTYEVHVTDGSGCVDSVEVSVGQVLGTLNAVPSSIVPVTCFGGTDGTASVDVLGTVTGSLSYAWSPGIWPNTDSISGLAAGTYTVDVTDSGNGCTTSIDITIPDAAPLALNVISAGTPDCNNFADAQVNASGGNGPFTYTWSTTPAQTGPFASNLIAGSYSVDVVDQNGCTTNTTVNIAGPQSPITVSFDSVLEATSCASDDGYISVSATGSSLITYTWLTTPTQVGPTISNLFPGSYQVIATGDNGCADTAGISLNIGCPLAPELTLFPPEYRDREAKLTWENRSGLELSRYEIWKGEDVRGLERFTTISVGQTPLTLMNYYDPQIVPNTTYFYQVAGYSLSGDVYRSDIQRLRVEESENMRMDVVYYDPENEEISIQLWLKYPSALNMRLFNNLGQQVTKKTFDLKSGITILKEYTRKLSSGVYTIQIVSSKGEMIENKIMIF
ncbi:MAG: hypothetical protein AAFQ83_13885 [Bacteroidota bacterium]